MNKAKIVLTAFATLMCTASSGLNGLPYAASAVTSSNIVYQDWKDTQRNRVIPVKIYLPRTGNAPFPVVIFSHGLGGSREAAQYLGDYWAERGYLGVFVQHEGSDSGVWQPAMGQGREAILARMREAANGKNLIARAQDIKFVLDELTRRDREDPDFKGQMKLDKIALAGHSFGAGTTLAIAGQNFGGKNMRDDRIKAAIYLCPPVTDGAKNRKGEIYGDIKIPGLLLTGTEDNSPIRETRAEDRRIPYDGMKAPHQFFVNWIGADHSTFGGRAFRQAKPSDDKFHEQIEGVTTKFLDATLKNDAAAWSWLDGSGVTSYLGKAAMFERK
jgi:dienelactone hydrolase